MLSNGTHRPQRFASRTWQAEIVGAPAMIMALGVFLRYPGMYLFERLMDPADARAVFVAGAYLLSFIAAFILVRFVQQAVLDRSILIGLTDEHFRIGTWVAGLNVLAATLSSVEPVWAEFAHAMAWPMWVLYAGWLVMMTVRRKLDPVRLNGTVFLSTVATQSMVIGFMTVHPGLVSDAIALLIVLNVLGIITYWISFTLTWVAGGLSDPLSGWVPQNNITHGALSITMLAAQMIEESMPGSLPYFHLVIQIAWCATALMVAASVVYELSLIRNRKKDLLRFRLGNYARNFTYAMFFASTYFGYFYSHPSIMKTFFSPSLLTMLALLVAAVNVWESFNQIKGSARSNRAVHSVA
jgi:hypothetical protein